MKRKKGYFKVSNNRLGRMNFNGNQQDTPLQNIPFYGVKMTISRLKIGIFFLMFAQNL